MLLDLPYRVGQLGSNEHVAGFQAALSAGLPNHAIDPAEHAIRYTECGDSIGLSGKFDDAITSAAATAPNRFRSSPRCSFTSMVLPACGLSFVEAGNYDSYTAVGSIGLTTH